MPTTPAPQRDDASLVAQARYGDLRAFALLVERHRGVVVRLCRQILSDRDLAEDAAQEAAIEALLNLDRLRRDDAFGPWWCGIALNLARRRLRHRAREAWSFDAGLGGRWIGKLADSEPDPAEQVVNKEIAEAVARAVSELPAGQRQAVLLFYYEGLPHRELAAELGVTVGSVKARLHRARDRLSRRLWSMKEEVMPTRARTDEIEMEVVDVRRFTDAETDPAKHVVVLQEQGGDRQLPIWVGPGEAEAIALALESVETPRPMTYQLMARLLGAAGVEVREVRITELTDRVYYAAIEVDAAGETRQVDARPSDAINLALQTEAPIRVTEAVLEAGGGDRHPEYQDYEATTAEIAREIRERIHLPKED